MRRVNLRRIPDILFLSIVPAILIYAGREDAVWRDFLSLSDQSRIDQFQAWAFFTGLGWSTILMPWRMRRVQKMVGERMEMFANILQAYKNTQMRLLGKAVGSNAVNFRTRVFILKWNPWTGRQTLEMSDFPGISDRFEEDDLVFLVDENLPEGVVGYAFKTGKGFLDFNPRERERYSLSEEQQSLLVGLRFWGAFPLFHKRNRKIVGIVSIESNDILPEEKRSEINDILKIYSAFVAVNFKKKRKIMRIFG